MEITIRISDDLGRKLENYEDEIPWILESEL